MYILTNTEKLFKHIHQNASGSYLWVVELWTNFTFFFSILLCHNFLKKQAHITSIFIYIHIHTHVYVYTYMYVYIFNLRNRNLNTCYFSSPLPFLQPLLQVTLVHPGWGRTSDGIEARPAAHPPMGLTPLS